MVKMGSARTQLGFSDACMKCSFSLTNVAFHLTFVTK